MRRKKENRKEKRRKVVVGILSMEESRVPSISASYSSNELLSTREPNAIMRRGSFSEIGLLLSAVRQKE